MLLKEYLPNRIANKYFKDKAENGESTLILPQITIIVTTRTNEKQNLSFYESFFFILIVQSLTYILMVIVFVFDQEPSWL